MKLVKRVVVGLVAGAVLAGISTRTVSAQQAQQPVALARCTKLPKATHMHGSAVIGKRLYIFGGENFDGWSNLVWSCEILPDGRLGTWREERKLPEYRSYINGAIEVVNNRIYVVGGGVVPSPKTPEDDQMDAQDVLWTEVNADGSLAEWKKSQPFPGPPLSCLATCSNDSQIFVIGGQQTEKVSAKDVKQSVSDNVLVADFAPDGSLKNWRVGARLPVSLWFEGAAIIDDRLYVWGGLTTQDNKSTNPRVFAAQVQRDGKLGPWQEETAMPYPVYSSAFCGFNDYLVSVGGRYAGSMPQNAIWYAPIVGKRVGQWQALNTDLDTRVYQSLGLDKSHGFVYVTGGSARKTIGSDGMPLVDTVQAFALPQPEASRLTSAAVAGAAKPAGSGAPAAGGRRDFKPLDEALKVATQGNKPVLAFFFSPQVPACRRFFDSVVNSPAFDKLAQDDVLALVDVSAGDMASSYKYNVFKVPALVLLKPDGTLVKRAGRLQTADDLKDLQP